MFDINIRKEDYIPETSVVYCDDSICARKYDDTEIITKIEKVDSKDFISRFRLLEIIRLLTKNLNMKDEDERLKNIIFLTELGLTNNEIRIIFGLEKKKIKKPIFFEEKEEEKAESKEVMNPSNIVINAHLLGD